MRGDLTCSSVCSSDEGIPPAPNLTIGPDYRSYFGRGRPSLVAVLSRYPLADQAEITGRVIFAPQYGEFTLKEC